jgi:hypothetical protein
MNIQDSDRETQMELVLGFLQSVRDPQTMQQVITGLMTREPHLDEFDLRVAIFMLLDQHRIELTPDRRLRIRGSSEASMSGYAPHVALQ